jgi:hypothetical protein
LESEASGKTHFLQLNRRRRGQTKADKDWTLRVLDNGTEMLVRYRHDGKTSHERRMWWRVQVLDSNDNETKQANVYILSVSNEKQKKLYHRLKAADLRKDVEITIHTFVPDLKKRKPGRPALDYEIRRVEQLRRQTTERPYFPQQPKACRPR